jgi:Uma2 family endonuclease
MSALAKKRWTTEEYLAFEHTSQERHEFVAGEVYLMTGASENHNLIVANIIIAVGIQLRNRPCKLYPSDMLIEIAATGDYHYPDISIVCEPAMIKREKQEILLNPTVIIEVLSPSTEQYDRGKKFHNYLTIDSLQEYILVSQDMARIECYRRQENNQWLYSDATALEAIVELPSIAAKLALADVYDKVTFDDEIS